VGSNKGPFFAEEGAVRDGRRIGPSQNKDVIGNDARSILLQRRRSLGT
jgi:hypothetical protein